MNYRLLHVSTFNMSSSGAVFFQLAKLHIQRDSKRWTQFRTSIFPEQKWYVNDLHNI